MMRSAPQSSASDSNSDRPRRCARRSRSTPAADRAARRDVSTPTSRRRRARRRPPAGSPPSAKRRRPDWVTWMSLSCESNALASAVAASIASLAISGSATSIGQQDLAKHGPPPGRAAPGRDAGRRRPRPVDSPQAPARLATLGANAQQYANSAPRAGFDRREGLTSGSQGGVQRLKRFHVLAFVGALGLGMAADGGGGGRRRQGRHRRHRRPCRALTRTWRGPGGVEAAKMAIADFGGSVLGQPIEVLTFDHQNKPDLGAQKAREWADQNGMTIAARRLHTGVKPGDERGDQGEEGPLLRHRRRRRLADRQGLHALHHPLRLRHHRARQRHGEDHFSARAARAGSSSPPTTPSAPQLQNAAGDVVKAGGGAGSARCACRSARPTSPPYLLQAQKLRRAGPRLANAGTDFSNSLKGGQRVRRHQVE